MNITISIASHGHGHLLHATLEALSRLPSLSCVDIILTLNKAEESFNPDEFPNLSFTVIRNTTPRGFGANHNNAIKHCKTRWVAVLNPDLAFNHGDPFPSLIHSAEKQTAHLIAPAILNLDESPANNIRNNLTPLSLIARYAYRPLNTYIRNTRIKSTNDGFFWVGGMFMVFRTETFIALNGFDQRYFMYCEDYDICARLYLAGYTLAVEPNSRVTHLAQQQSRKKIQHFIWHCSSLRKVWFSRAFWLLLRRDITRLLAKSRRYNH